MDELVGRSRRAHSVWGHRTTECGSPAKRSEPVERSKISDETRTKQDGVAFRRRAAACLEAAGGLLDKGPVDFEINAELALNLEDGMLESE